MPNCRPHRAPGRPSGFARRSAPGVGAVRAPGVGAVRARLGLVALLILAMANLGCSSSAAELKQREEKAGFHYKLALGYFEGRNIDLSIRELIKAFEMDEGHADSRYLYGFILFGRKRYEEAASNLRKALQRRPKFFAARNHLGVTYLAMERWADAIVALEPLLKEPTYTTPYLAHNNIGWAYLKEGNLRMAEKHLRMSVFVNPRFCQGHRNLSLLAVEQRDLAAAVQHMEEAVRRCPNVAELQFQMGEVLSASSQTERAQAAFGRCAKQAGDTLLGRRCQARLIGGGVSAAPRDQWAPGPALDMGGSDVR